MEKPIDLVSRFCAAWGNDLGADDLAAFFTDDAVYHNIPFEPVTGKRTLPTTSPRSSVPARPASSASNSASSTSPPTVRS